MSDYTVVPRNQWQMIITDEFIDEPYPFVECNAHIFEIRPTYDDDYYKEYRCAICGIRAIGESQEDPEDEYFEPSESFEPSEPYKGATDGYRYEGLVDALKIMFGRHS